MPDIRLQSTVSLPVSDRERNRAFSSLVQIREKRPLLHCISNLVSANDCANIALAVGASPMMAQAEEEMEEITAISDVTVLNTGTPDRDRFQICRLCGTAAVRLGKPIILDPVGIGASSWRLREIRQLLEAFRPDILRVNLGEATALCRTAGFEKGVDVAGEADRTYRQDIAAELAGRLHTTVLLSGEDDLVHDGRRVAWIEGGSEQMACVTGTGCMLSVLCGAFAAVEKDAFRAAEQAAAFWKRCAEKADSETQKLGIGSFRIALINAAGQLSKPGLSHDSRASLCPEEF